MAYSWRPCSRARRGCGEPGCVSIPVDAGLVNVREHGLRGDGTTDDAGALLRLGRSNLDQHKTLFFPAGTYPLSDSIPWADAAG